MELIVKPFDELTTAELYEILRLRVDVFVVEQHCPYPEIDGRDLAAVHLFLQDGTGIHAYLRLLPPGVSFDTASLGRVVVRGAPPGPGPPDRGRRHPSGESPGVGHAHHRGPDLRPGPL